MDAPHPVLVRFGGGFRRQAVDLQILRRAAVAKTLVEKNFNASDLADLLDAREIRFAVAQGGLDAHLVVHVGVGTDPAHDLAGSIADGHGARQVPAIEPGRVAQAELDFVVGAFAYGFGPNRDGPLDIVRMHDGAPAVAVEFARACACVFMDLMIEPIEFAFRCCRPNMVRHHRGERAELGLAFAQRLLGTHALGRLDHDRQHPRRLAVLVEQRAVVEIDPQILGPAGAVQDQMLVAERQCFPAQADVHHPAVEVCHLGPALQHLGAEQLGVAAAGKYRIRIVVDHDAVAAPQHHQGHGGAQDDVDGRLQALRPARSRSKGGRGPVEGADQCAHLPAAGGKW